MARPAKEESENRVEQIVDAAAALFAEKGLDNTTVAEIAMGCGIRAPSVLHYFGTKEALFLEVVRVRVQQRFIDEFRLTEIDFSQPPAGVLEAALQTGMNVWRQEPRLIGAAFAELLRPGGVGKELINDLLIPLLTRFEQAAATLLPTDACTPVPVREIALMFVFSLAGRFATIGDDPNLWGPESEVLEVLQLMLRAVIGQVAAA